MIICVIRCLGLSLIVYVSRQISGHIVFACSLDIFLNLVITPSYSTMEVKSRYLAGLGDGFFSNFIILKMTVAMVSFPIYIITQMLTGTLPSSGSRHTFHLFFPKPRLLSRSRHTSHRSLFLSQITDPSLPQKWIWWKAIWHLSHQITSYLGLRCILTTKCRFHCNRRRIHGVKVAEFIWLSSQPSIQNYHKFKSEFWPWPVGLR